jgi:hypothetical protein
MESSVPFFNIDPNMSEKDQTRTSLEKFFALVYFEESHRDHLDSGQEGLNILRGIVVGTENSAKYTCRSLYTAEDLD